MRRTEREWAEIVGNYKASGLSLRQFCQTENIGEQSLRNWNKRNMRESGTKTTNDHGFVEVRSASNAESQMPYQEQERNPVTQRSALIIRFRDDTVIEIHPDTDRHTLAWVLALMVNRQ